MWYYRFFVVLFSDFSIAILQNFNFESLLLYGNILYFYEKQLLFGIGKPFFKLRSAKHIRGFPICLVHGKIPCSRNKPFWIYGGDKSCKEGIFWGK